jgi:hypothetical protein
MPNAEALQQILDDPSRSAEDKQIARQTLDRINPVAQLERELLQATGKSKLGAIDYHDIHKFCTAYGWREPQTMELWWRWLFGPHGE